MISSSFTDPLISLANAGQDLNADTVIKGLFMGLLLGALGQGFRVVVGLKKAGDTAQTAGTTFQDQFDASRLLVSLLIGAIAGALAALPLLTQLDHFSYQALSTLVAAGYAGADFIEGFMRRAGASVTPTVTGANLGQSVTSSAPPDSTGASAASSSSPPPALQVNYGEPVPTGDPDPSTAPLAPFLPISYHSQDKSNWCWAACCQMVFAFAPPRSAQPQPYGMQWQIAQTVWGLTYCPDPVSCADVTSQACNYGAWPEDAYYNPGYNYSYHMDTIAVGPAVLQDEIVTNSRPVEACVQWDGGGAHVVLFVGLYQNGNLQVIDPDPYYKGAPFESTYANAQRYRGVGTWNRSYTKLCPSRPS